ncbi:MAG: DNA polymerase IV [Gemmatimonadales bacterium]
MPSQQERTQLSSERRILLADADAFFVAVARLADPEGAGAAPLLVVGGSAEGRGVVTSASYETRRFGVRSGMPMAQALRLCPRATRVPVPRELCRRKSREIRNVLREFTPIVESASIDEFYLDMTGTSQLYGDESLTCTAGRIRERVWNQTGLRVSIGGGGSRLVAKLAAKRAKPQNRGATGVFVIAPGSEARFLSQLKLADIPGVGPRLQGRLASRGLTTVRDALAIDPDSLTAWLGPRTGAWLYDRMRGVDDAPVIAHAAAKSLSREETFATDLDADADLEQRALRQATRLAAELRAKRFFARTISVKLRDADFTTRQASHTLDTATASDRPIRDSVRQLLGKLRAARRTPARLVGVAASNLVQTPDCTQQLSLFDNASSEARRDHQLLEAVDSINTRFGNGRIVRAADAANRLATQRTRT